MNQNLICPTCKESYIENIDFCKKCNYPFSGTEKEKAIFVGQQILKKGKISDTKDKIKRARNILWILGGFNIIYPTLFLVNSPYYQTELILGVFFGLLFIGCGFLSYKKPLISIIVPLSILLISYALKAIINPFTLVQGLLWKVIILSALGYAFKRIIDSEKIKRESSYLNDQHYK